jgi:prepilin-type N-terminal cleavage/methylation domain-containing protein
MPRARGFTLLEIMISVCILLVILMLAVPSLSGVVADKRLRRSLNAFDDLVRQAQERSVAEHRAYLIVWGDKHVALRPEAFAQDEQPVDVAELLLAHGDSLSLSLPSALRKDPPAEWIFWPSGNCEPAIVTFKSGNGSWSANYSPLTARGELISYAAR